jgi:tetratricopeptide (TPR) repeat protein
MPMIKLFIQIFFSVLSCAVLAWAGEFCANVQAQDYMGASALLQQVEESHAKPGSKQTNEVSNLRDDLKAFSKNAAALAPADAAKQWLELVDRAAKIQQQAGGSDNSSDMPVSGQDLLAALPPPVDWSTLAQAIAERPKPTQNQAETREIGLDLLAATLTGDIHGRNLAITNLEEKANQADTPMAMMYGEFLRELSQALVATSADPDAALNSLEQQMSAASPENPATLEVPNLVAQVGPQKAEAFLRRALVAPNVILQFNQPNATSRLAQKLGLELLDQMKIPQWGLVNSIDSVELYEAMDKHFGEKTNTPVALPGLPAGIRFPQPGFQMNDTKGLARVYYMLGLISRGQTQQAVAAAKRAKGFESDQFASAFDAMDRAGYAVQLDDFLYQLLSQDPALPYWDQYVEFAAKAGQTDRMVALVRGTLARPDLSDNRKASLRQILFTALLAADDVDEGVQEMRRLMTNNVPPEPGMESYNKGQLGAMLARIGVLMTNSEWTDEGIIAARQWLTNSSVTERSPWETEPVIASLTQTLLELNRGPEAESILADALANATRPGNSERDYDWEGPPGRQILTALAVLYYKAGRHDDVLLLLQNSPDWGARDLSDLFEAEPWADDQHSFMDLYVHSSPLPVPYMAAAALAARGRTEEAQRIDDALLDNAPALDRGYELLISLKGTNAIPQLDEMFKADQFQTRPLIWKAHLLQQEGQLEQAEKIVRQAITIDPSDGEEGRGDRMRAYAELADIREARGDQKEADFYRQIVQAIRVSEDADQFYMAGLLKRAVAMYEQGLDHFADAYCI